MQEGYYNHSVVAFLMVLNSQIVPSLCYFHIYTYIYTHTPQHPCIYVYCITHTNNFRIQLILFDPWYFGQKNQTEHISYATVKL